MKKFLFVLLVAVIAITNKGYAQDPHFSQFYANPLYINPAFAGTVVCPRFSLNYRNQWPGLGAFQTFSASYDQYFDAINGGVGVIVMSDKQSETYSNNSAALMYSLRLRATDKIYVNLALQASIINRALSWDKLTFPSMIDPRYGFIYNIRPDAPDNLSKTYADFSAGAVIYGDNWYGGVSFAHLTQPNEGYISYSKIPLKTTVHGGMRFNIMRDARRTNAFLGTPIISPNIIYHNQGSFHDLNYGLYLDWSPFIVGAWFRQAIAFSNADAFVFLVGLQYDAFKVGYSYDLNVSSLANASGGAHEISLGIQLNCPEKRKKLKSIDCPSF